MSVAWRLAIAAGALCACCGLSATEELQPPEETGIMCGKWLRRIEETLPRVKDQVQRASAASFSISAFVAVGEPGLAKKLVEQFVSSEERPLAIMRIAGCQASDGQWAEALATAQELDVDTRQGALALIAVLQAKRGSIENASKTLESITEQSQRDRALAALAKAQAAASQHDAARRTVNQIRSAQGRSRASKAIEGAEEDPLRCLRFGLLRDNLVTMLLFSDAGRYREALAAIAAAQSEDHDALAQHLDNGLRQCKAFTQLERATMETLLAVALAEAGQRDRAREMILAAQKSNKGEWLGVASMFGAPVLVQLLIRLDMNNEVDVIMASYDRSDSITYRANLAAVGAAYGSLGRIQEAEEYYTQLESPVERIYFATGFVEGLSKQGTCGAKKTPMKTGAK